MWAIKVDINLLNQHCKPNCLAGWLTNWLTEALGHSRRSRDSGTRALNWFKGHLDTWALKALEGHVSTPTPRALGHLGHSGSRRALGHSGTQGTWVPEHYLGTQDTRALRHLDNHALKGHLGIWELRYSGNWALEALEALYLPDPKL